MQLYMDHRIHISVAPLLQMRKSTVHSRVDSGCTVASTGLTYCSLFSTASPCVPCRRLLYTTTSIRGLTKK
jgi:hypothetical protein